MKMIRRFKNRGAIVGLALITCLAVSSVNAKPPQGPERLLEAVQVTEEQKESVLAVLKTQHEKRREVHQQYRDSREEERAAMDALHTETVTLLSSILSEEQIRLFEAFIAQNRPPRPDEKSHQRMLKN